MRSISENGNSTQQQIPAEPLYQVPFADGIRKAVNSMPAIAVGLITEPRHAESIVANGQADAIAVARAILYQPHWPWQAAAELGGSVIAPPQYLRSEPHGHKGLLKAAD